MFSIQLPSKKELGLCVALWSIYFAVVSIFVGLRPDNVLLAILFIVMFCCNRQTRRIAYAMIPFTLFGICYDWMRIFPNYMVNSIDVQSLNEAERGLFGISVGEHVLTPNEFFSLHHCAFADFLSGVFYLCWVPVPIAFGLYLFFTGRKQEYAHFAWAFLFVNLIGFAGYYIHPAAPPWYAMEYGFEPVLGTPGSVAGLGRFDALVGIDIFQGIYGKNANVFAAVPSLHAAYMLIATIYAFRYKVPGFLRITFCIITLGIWWTAVYTAHHYVIDVALGIVTACVGVFFLEYMSKVAKWLDHFFCNYAVLLGQGR